VRNAHARHHFLLHQLQRIVMVLAIGRRFQRAGVGFGRSNAREQQGCPGPFGGFEFEVRRQQGCWQAGQSVVQKGRNAGWRQELSVTTWGVKNPLFEQILRR